ncbi:MAG TPA: hypothetical protein VF682_26435 [Pseudomonas sp.]
MTTAGTWEKSITAAAGRHSFTAREQGGVESQAWVITVVIEAQPVITIVTDSKGEVADGSTTFDTSVTLSGSAAPNKYVEIFDGATPDGTASVNANGDWSHELVGLSIASHSITVKGLYDSNPVSAARTFTVAALIAITSVRDSIREVANGRTTVDTTVTLSGRAEANQQVEILDGATSKGTVNVTFNGDWTLRLSGLSIASHSITAKGLYGSNPVSSARTFNVLAETAPTITGVWDSKGEVPDGGSTIESIVTVTGKAVPLQQVRVLSHTADVIANGDWAVLVTGLNVARWLAVARALYGSNRESALRVLNVVNRDPTVDSVKDSKGELPDGGQTVDKTVTLAGKGSVYSNVDILDQSVVLTRLATNGYGDWTTQLSGLGVRTHRIQAKGVYGRDPLSPARTFTVVNAN